MSKLWIAVLLLSCSSSLAAADKADFTLKWQRDKTSASDPILRWRAEQKTSTNQSPLSPMSEQQSRQHDMLGRISKANRQRYIDPNFSSFNSDDGYNHITLGGKIY